MYQFYAQIAARNKMLMLPVHVTESKEKKKFLLICWEEISFLLSKEFPDLSSQEITEEVIEKMMTFIKMSFFRKLLRMSDKIPTVGLVVVGEFNNSDKNEM